MNPTWIILGRELAEIRRAPLLVLSMASLPATLVGVPLVTVWYLISRAQEVAIVFLEQLYGLTPKAPAEIIAEAAALNWLPIFLVMPVFLPIIIAAQAIGGERDRHTLEPLLATPASTGAIVVGKSLAAVVPAVVITWLSALAFIGGLNLLVWRHSGGWPLPDRAWTFAVLVLAPLLALFGNTLAVLISARVADTRAAQNIAAMSVVPLVGLLVAQMSGKVMLGIGFYLGLAAAMLVVDLGLIALTIHAVDRERLLIH